MPLAKHKSKTPKLRLRPIYLCELYELKRTQRICLLNIVGFPSNLKLLNWVAQLRIPISSSLPSSLLMTMMLSSFRNFFTAVDLCSYTVFKSESTNQILINLSQGEFYNMKIINQYAWLHILPHYSITGTLRCIYKYYRVCLKAVCR